MKGSKLRETILIRANLSEANFTEADLAQSDLRQANLRGANIDHATLLHANLQEADLRDTHNANPLQLSKARSLNDAQLDAPLYERLKQDYPHLFGP